MLLQFGLHEVAVRCPTEPVLYLEHEPENEAGRLYEQVGFRTASRDEIFSASGLYPKGSVMYVDLEPARRVKRL